MYIRRTDSCLLYTYPQAAQQAAAPTAPVQNEQQKLFTGDIQPETTDPLVATIQSLSLIHISAALAKLGDRDGIYGKTGTAQFGPQNSREWKMCIRDSPQS